MTPALADLCLAYPGPPGLPEVERTPWSILRLFDRGTRGTLGRTLAAVELDGALSSDMLDRVLSISREGIIVGTLLSVFWDQPQSTVELSPTFTVRPEPGRRERVILVDAAMFTQFTMMASESKMAEFYPALDLRVVGRLTIGKQRGSPLLKPGEELRGHWTGAMSLVDFPPEEPEDARAVNDLTGDIPDEDSQKAMARLDAMVDQAQRDIDQQPADALGDSLLQVCTGAKARQLATWLVLSEPRLLMQAAAWAYGHLPEGDVTLVAGSRYGLPLATLVATMGILDGRTLPLGYASNLGQVLRLSGLRLGRSREGPVWEAGAGRLQGREVVVVDSLVRYGLCLSHLVDLAAALGAPLRQCISIFDVLRHGRVSLPPELTITSLACLP